MPMGDDFMLLIALHSLCLHSTLQTLCFFFRGHQLTFLFKLIMIGNNFKHQILINAINAR